MRCLNVVFTWNQNGFTLEGSPLWGKARRQREMQRSFDLSSKGRCESMISAIPANMLNLSVAGRGRRELVRWLFPVVGVVVFELFKKNKK